MRVKFVVPFSLLAVCFTTGCFNGSKRFEVRQVAPGIYEGFKPTTKAHFQELKRMGIKTILNVETIQWNIFPERHLAHKNGLIFRNVPILASPLQPKGKRVKEALLTMNNPSLHPIYIHCLLGRDRTALLLALYRVYYLNWRPENAWAEMVRSGFKPRWTLRGFETYFWDNCQRPDWAAVARAAPKEH